MNKLLAGAGFIVVLATIYRWNLTGFEEAILLLFFILLAMVARIPVPATPKPRWLKVPAAEDHSPWAETRRAFFKGRRG